MTDKIGQEPACNCKGKISLCDHSKHGRSTGFGEVCDMWGNIISRHSDPSWQCTGCGMPLTDAMCAEGEK